RSSMSNRGSRKAGQYYIRFGREGPYFSAESVGPDVPRGSRLGPDAENKRAASIFGSTRTPTKQFCISSQFWSPQWMVLFGSGLNLLATELSKCATPMMRVPFGSAFGSARAYPICQFKSHFALKTVSVLPVGY